MRIPLYFGPVLVLAAFGAQAASPTPVIASVANGASMASGPVAPGMYAFVHGSNLSSFDWYMMGYPLPLSVNGVSVQVNGTPAPLFGVSAGLIVLQVPFEVTGTSATFKVTIQTGGQTLESAAFAVPLASTAPGLFAAGGDGTGVLNCSSLSNETINMNYPAHPGQTVTAYGTGFGATNPAVADGTLPASAAPLVANVTVTVGGENATVVSAGLTTASDSFAGAGYDKVTFVLPADLPNGYLLVVMTVGGAISQAGVVIPVGEHLVTITGVSNDATGAVAAVVSGSWVSIYGYNLSSNTRQWGAADFSGGNLPLILDGVSVQVNGKAAAVYYISPYQLVIQAPSDSATGKVSLVVKNSYGTGTGTATLATYAPALFQVGLYVAAVHTDGSFVGPAGLFPGSRPARPGETILLYGTGFGPTNPAVPAGVIPQAPAPLADLSLLHIGIGGMPATVSWAGIVSPGDYQFNVVIPALADGDQEIVANAGGYSTQNGILIPVKK